MEHELVRLAEKVLNGGITERVSDRKVLLTADEPATTAIYAAERTNIYDVEPAAVLDYIGTVSGDWKMYVTEDRDEFRAMAKASFEQELYEYLENHSRDTEEQSGG